MPLTMWRRRQNGRVWLNSDNFDDRFEEISLSSWPRAASALPMENPEEGCERPKVVIKKDRLRVFFCFLLVHAPPLAVTLFLIVLNIKTYFYGIDGSRIGLFQFAAKIHDILMERSIVAVVVAYGQRLLTGPSAIPFGALFSAYQVLQIGYLWSSEFYAAVTARGFPPVLKTGFLLFVPASMLLAIAVGPSSAIAMQPRMTNYSLPDCEIALNVSYDVLYPESLVNVGPQYLEFDPTFDSYNDQVSPASGWENLQHLPIVGGIEETTAGFTYSTTDVDHDNVDRDSAPPLVEVVPDMPPIYSVPFSTLRGDRTLYVQYAPNSTFAIIQQEPIMPSLYRAADSCAGNLPAASVGEAVFRVNMPQPYVSVICKLNIIMNESDTRPIQFPNTYVSSCISGDDCANKDLTNNASTRVYTGITRRQLWTETKTRPEGRAIWVDDIQISRPNAHKGLGVIVVQPELCTGGNTTFLTTSACAVGATWANTTSIMHLAFNGFLPIPNDAAHSVISYTTPSTLPEWSRPSVSLSKLWAEGLSPCTNTQNQTVVDNLLRMMLVTDNLCPRNGEYELGTTPIGKSRTRPFMHEGLIAALIASGMSNAAGITEQWARNLSDKNCPWMLGDLTMDSSLKQSNPQGIILTFQGSLPGYAWSLDSTSIKLALAVLILYCVYVIAYLAYAFSAGHVSTSWSTISGLTALAINSHPTHVLRFTSAGIERTDTFRNLVSLREIEETGQLELVFQQDEENWGACRRVTEGKAY